MLRASISIIMAFLGSSAPAAFAQVSEATPRQTFTAFITGTPVADLRFKPYVAEKSTPAAINTLPGAVPTAIPLAPPPIMTEPAAPEAEPEPTSKPFETEAALLPPPLLVPEAIKTKSNELIPFYATAAQYLEARGRDKDQQLSLTYSVSVANAQSGLKVAPKTVTLLIGPDYAAVTRDTQTKIFDFRMQRLLTLRTTESEANEKQVFDNVSLYPGALRNIDTVNGATNKGKRTSISIGPETTLDAFWLESSLGWAARTDFGDLDVTRKDRKVTTKYKTFEPAAFDLSGPDMPSEDHMRTFFAYLLHDLPVHPAILPRMGRPDKAPSSMTLLSYTPKYPGGLNAYWTLKDTGSKKAPFPLPASTPSGLSGSAVTPLAVAVKQAAKGDALTNRPSDDDLRQDIHNKREAGEPFEAWISAQMLAHRLGGCENDPALLCADIAALEDAAAPNSPLAELSAVLKQADKRRPDASVFEALMPFVGDQIAPAFLVKITGKTRSRILGKAITSETLRAISAESLLEEALLKDPYDPETYMVLGQVYAARGRYAESWDIQDAMRKLSATREKHRASIDKAEATVKRIAPGFFVSKYP